jgi:hypothetical protein
MNILKLLSPRGIEKPLIVPIPPPNTARLRFVTTKRNFIGRLIRIRESEGAVSHVEAVMADGSILAYPVVTHTH